MKHSTARYEAYQARIHIYIYIQIYVYIHTYTYTYTRLDDNIHTIVRNEIFICSSRLDMYIHENMCILIYMYKKQIREGGGGNYNLKEAGRTGGGREEGRLRDERGYTKETQGIFGTLLMVVQRSIKLFTQRVCCLCTSLFYYLDIDCVM